MGFLAICQERCWPAVFLRCHSPPPRFSFLLGHQTSFRWVFITHFPQSTLAELHLGSLGATGEIATLGKCRVERSWGLGDPSFSPLPGTLPDKAFGLRACLSCTSSSDPMRPECASVQLCKWRRGNHLLDWLTEGNSLCKRESWESPTASLVERMRFFGVLHMPAEWLQS